MIVKTLAPALALVLKIKVGQGHGHGQGQGNEFIDEILSFGQNLSSTHIKWSPSVKKILQAFLSAILLSTTTLEAQIESGGDFGSESIVREEQNEEQHPFTLKIYGDAIRKAKFNKWYIDNQHLDYSTITGEADCVFYYNEDHREGLSANLYYNRTNLIWNENPFFDETIFRTVTFGLGGFSSRIPNWLWLAEARINVDATHFKLSTYANYDFYIWGRYNYSPTFGLHSGFIAQTGMKIDHVYPIIGFDWQIYENLKLNAIYPVNLSIVYIYNTIWSFAVAGRFFDHRQRVGEHEFLPMALWWYRSRGIELAANYDYNSWLHANLHIGWTFSSKLTISTRHNKHKRHFNLKDAPYFGAQVDANF